MRHNAHHVSDDPELVRRLIRANPWGIIVSAHAGGVVASHYPLLLDESSDELALLTHVGRPDESLHGLGQHELLIIVQGTHGYISPSWYAPGATRAPTWNFTAAHLYGTPELLDEATNLAVLARLVEHFEREVENPVWLDPLWAAPVALGTVGMRVPITRFQAKVKLSQDKDPQSRRQVIQALREPGPYANPVLADEMAAALAPSGETAPEE